MRAGLVQRGVREARSTVRRFGFRPLRIGLAFADKVRARMRLRRVRRDYRELVAEPEATAALRLPPVGLAPAARLPAELAEAAERLRDEAQRVAAHEVDYLGSGPVALGPEIDWQRDFKSGYRWPSVFYEDVEVTRLTDDSDAKVPWELSRGHQLLTLARAARVWEDEGLAAELERQLDHWIAANPPGVGINWVNPMEIALRAVNWLWALGTVEPWRPVDPALRARVTRSLQAHARHIRLNLEGSPLLRGNHYLSDVFGLLVLGEMLPGDPRARAWARQGRRAMEREVVGQVLEDGVGFEASLPYHGLALEIFLLGWHVIALDGRAPSARYRARVERMLEVSRAIRHPGGRSPVLGDQDSGRVLPAGFARPATQDNLLDLGAAILGLPRLHDGAPHEEVAWTLGVGAWEALAARPVSDRPPATAFPVDGLYVLDGDGVHAVARFGGVGQNGNGGHAHNDLSSYELSLGAPLVVDAGTYLYTADVAARDAFRSARAHNVTVVDGLDMHPLPPGQPFQMPAHARHRVEAWSRTQDRVVLVGSHDGFSRGGERIVVRRRFELDRRAHALEVTDEVQGSGRHEVETLVHLAPGREATVAGERVQVSGGAEIVFSPGATVSVESGWVSSQYGVREPAPVVRATASGELPARIGYRIEAP